MGGNRISILMHIDEATAAELVYFLKKTVNIFCFMWLYSLGYLIYAFYDNIVSSCVIMGLMVLYLIYIILFRKLCYLESPDAALLQYTMLITLIIFLVNPIYTIYRLVHKWDPQNGLAISGLVYQIFFELNLLSTIFLLRKLKALMRKEEIEA